MKIKNTIRKMNMVPLLMAGFLFGACSSEPAAVIKKGEKFTFGDNEITIDYKVSTVLVNEETQQTLVAPEGKAYLIVDVTAKDGSYFLDVNEGETKLEETDYLIAQPFVRKIEIGKDAERSNLYLVDLANKNYVIAVKSFGDEMATLAVGELKDEATVKVSDRMKAFMNEFKDGIHLQDAVKKYIKEGTDIYSVVSEEGQDVPLSPITKGVQIDYIAPDGSITCSSEFGVEKMVVTWDGDYISKLVFKM